ncbi:D-galactonate transporter [Edaphobacter acidisoli]|uniref:D-galactonate transporter n=1 Tax=Edaphobacter acidisoli TaxID=2040573 RepID=A0A916W893_9BACT|nr:MFS transporter [Edaphobacter acidisoli]GGA76077.1 D-galactonate transporter [Edaphobacter acidisoli]
MLFAASAFSYGDRVALSIAGVSISRDLHLNALRLGYLFSGFSWAYVAGQLPAGGLLDRYGSKRVYGTSIVLWSLCALLVGFAGYLPAAIAFSVIFGLRLLSGLAQSPVFPGNGRIVASWFPTAERGTASAIFNSSQYFALVLFGPIMGWIVHISGWKQCFWFLGALGFVLVYLWSKVIHGVKDHPRINQAEIDFIEQGGGLTNIDFRAGKAQKPANRLTWSAVKMLLSNRMLVGIYLGQYCITTLTWFFLTWFPVYLYEARHMSIVKVGIMAALPALCGSIGGILGGVVSDKLLRMGHSLTFARKVPIVSGMLLAVTMLGCNYTNTQWLVMVLLSFAFFGKGFGALGWTVIADTSPKPLIGINGGLFNLIGNLAGVTTPIVIGYIVKRTGSFNDALIFVAATAVMAIVAYLPIVGEIKRVDFDLPEPSGGAA